MFHIPITESFNLKTFQFKKKALSGGIANDKEERYLWSRRAE